MPPPLALGKLDLRLVFPSPCLAALWIIPLCFKPQRPSVFVLLCWVRWTWFRNRLTLSSTIHTPFFPLVWWLIFGGGRGVRLLRIWWNLWFLPLEKMYISKSPGIWQAVSGDSRSLWGPQIKDLHAKLWASRKLNSYDPTHCVTHMGIQLLFFKIHTHENITGIYSSNFRQILCEHVSKVCFKPTARR